MAARGNRSDRGQDRAVYIISVAAELAGVHPQTLRMYERRGLLAPKRTSGNTRRYSERDIERIRMIQELTRELALRVGRDPSRVAGGAEIIPLRSWLAFPWERKGSRS